MEKVFTNDEQELKEILFNELPEFKKNETSISFNHTGWTSIIIDINDDLIVKFPRNVEKYNGLVNEKKVIQVLKNNVQGVEFPTRDIFDGKTPFFIHKKLKGEHFPLDRLKIASKEEQKNFIVSAAEFLNQIHSIPTSLFAGILPKKEEILPNCNDFMPYLDKEFSKSEINVIERLLNEFNQVTALKHNNVVGYYDFHGNNIVIDKKTKKITGVFDFDEMSIGSIEFDLRELPLNYGVDFGFKMIDECNRCSNVSIDVRNMKTFLTGWYVFEFSNLVKNKEYLLKNIKNLNIDKHKQNILGQLYSYDKEFLHH
ncbi:MAG: Bifunctional AAC [Alphaproteobacteria bacterium ADurb.Bin438]|nr:MAG: Bifunctional AAC [Alphaproteobacteria bacterium ADurb.Bin438]